jgi:hypothetical protein
MKSGNLKFLEPSGPLQAFNGTDLPSLPFIYVCSLSHYMTSETAVPDCDIGECSINDSIVVAAGIKCFLNIISSLITFKRIFESYKAINCQIFIKLPQSSVKDRVNCYIVDP